VERGAEGPVWSMSHGRNSLAFLPEVSLAMASDAEPEPRPTGEASAGTIYPLMTVGAGESRLPRDAELAHRIGHRCACADERPHARVGLAAGEFTGGRR
jgi:hypothetical protein